jgi:hypothetical protein
MNDYEEKDLKKLLKDAMPPFAETTLRRDLWPVLLQRLQAQPLRVPWWDWALLAVAASVFLFFPGMIPALLYHF